MKPINRRICDVVSLVGSAAVILLARPAIAERPNVVVFLSDDQGWGDLSLNGNSNLNTPNIDCLAAEGAQFDRFFVCPVCSPTRAEFLTGRYHPRGGVYSTSAGGERLNLDEVTIGDTFRDAGYATAAYGKWHNGMQYPYHPNGRGFDDYYGFCSGHWGHYYSPLIEHNGELTTGEGYLIDDLTTHAIDFIQSHQDQPFFVYLPYNTPHSPMQVPDSWWDKFENKDIVQRHRDPEKEDVDFTRAALAMCENIDWNVGRVLDTLDNLDLADDTIVVYFNDNGPNSSRWNGGMKGRKGSTDEGGVRSTLVVRWPGKVIAGRSIKPIAAAIDLLPTLADMAGVPLRKGVALDGTSVKPLLLEDSPSWDDRVIMSHWRKKVSARSQQYRLDTNGALFDMKADPQQRRDVAPQHPETTARLQAEIDRFRTEVLTGYDDDQRPFVISHPDYPVAQIPARDGITHGKIQRSNKFPNCSYFTNWTSTDDSITWEAEAQQEGDYEVEIHYTCAATDVGSVIQLSFGENTVTGVVDKPVESPVIGAAEDRVPRRESYVKEFGTMQLGTIHLTPGKSRLTLQALSIPGQQVMDFRLLMLRRQ
jgi:arylsulfatase A-like enzyme